ncbi:MAG: hypothetical protein EXQ58_06135 [Acidobacteria bacterium]|nr:hypothetical protein [Acidobacteriota bacterium]
MLCTGNSAETSLQFKRFSVTGAVVGLRSPVELSEEKVFSLGVFINPLRRKIEIDTSHPRHIIT